MTTKRQQCKKTRGQRTCKNVEAKSQDGEWLVKRGMQLHVTLVLVNASLPPFFQHA